MDKWTNVMNGNIEHMTLRMHWTAVAKTNRMRQREHKIKIKSNREWEKHTGYRDWNDNETD